MAAISLSTDTYSFLNCGTCLGELVPDGSFLDADSSSEIRIGDIVAVVIKTDSPLARLGNRLSGDGLLGVTKIFLGSQQSDADETIYLFGQLNPPVVAPVPACALEAMHLVTGGQTPEGALSELMGDDDRAAMELLGPFFRECGAQPPINREWRPTQEGYEQ